VDLGGPGCLVCPGLIDVHLHLPQFDSIGADGMTLLDWLDRVVFPAEARWADPAYAGQMTERVVGQLLAHGTTGIAAYATVHHEAALAAIEVLGRTGMRGYVGQVLMDRNAPAELCRDADQLIAETATLLDRKAVGRIEPAVTPRFAISCTGPLLEQAGELAGRYGAVVQTHLAETERECALIGELFSGVSYTEVYQRAGLLGPRSILGHGIWLDSQERRTLSETGSIIAHCPTANAFLQSGAMDRAGLLAGGVRLGLGSDVAGGPDRSMVRVARAMIETAKARGSAPPTPAEAWWQITAGNADVLGWDDAGRIAAGRAADLIVFEPDIPWRDAPDPLGTLLYAWDDRWLRQVVLEGRVVWDGRRL
jgi:guanine deaminase